MAYVYIKDEEGFVVKKKKSEVLATEQIITKEEYDELSGDNYYKKKFGHGGKRTGAGRKPQNGVSKQDKHTVRFYDDNGRLLFTRNGQGYASGDLAITSTDGGRTVRFYDKKGNLKGVR